MIQALILTAAIACFYYFVTKPLNYWKNKGVKQTNTFKSFKNTIKQFFQLENHCSVLQNVYDSAPDDRFVGFYQFSTPNLMIRDPELIKQITVKDFNYFVNHRVFVPAEADPLWGRNLFAMRDQNWRDMRTTLSPLFTSSKMKIMYNLMSECAENVTKHFHNQKIDLINVTMKDLAARYANDIIATTAMGFQVDSIDDPDNHFYKMAKIVSNMSGFWKMVKFVFAFQIFPRLYKIAKLQFYTGESRQFFVNLIEEAVHTRKTEGIIRPDMIHLLIQAQHKLKEKQSNDTNNNNEDDDMEITMEDITAHALMFFIAGFESSSGFICLMAYELVANPDIQKKLRKEIDDSFKECNNNLTYENVMQMKYLDMVVSETMRRWPNFVATDRECTQEYIIKPENPWEPELKIEKGTVIQLPIYAIQNDPKHFPNPEKFDPERFSNENKHKINPYAYIPFGVGPRVCIGTRFALMQTKIFFVHVLHNFEIVATSNTKIPFEASKKSFNISIKNGLQLAFKKLVK